MIIKTLLQSIKLSTFKDDQPHNKILKRRNPKQEGWVGINQAFVIIPQRVLKPYATVVTLGMDQREYT